MATAPAGTAATVATAVTTAAITVVAATIVATSTTAATPATATTPASPASPAIVDSTDTKNVDRTSLEDTALQERKKQRLEKLAIRLEYVAKVARELSENQHYDESFDFIFKSLTNQIEKMERASTGYSYSACKGRGRRGRRQLSDYHPDQYNFVKELFPALFKKADK